MKFKLNVIPESWRAEAKENYEKALAEFTARQAKAPSKLTGPALTTIRREAMGGAGGPPPDPAPAPAPLPIESIPPLNNSNFAKLPNSIRNEIASYLSGAPIIPLQRRNHLKPIKEKIANETAKTLNKRRRNRTRHQTRRRV